MIKPYADNVLIELEPEQTEYAGGLYCAPDKKTARAPRIAKVLAVGPGHFRDKRIGAGGKAAIGVFIPTEVRPGERVIVDKLAGQDWSMDLTVPRHNKTPEFKEFFGRNGDFRFVREDEILGVLEECDGEAL